MIDIEKLENAFTNYIQNYDLNEINTKRKYHHSFRVKDISTIIAQKLNLDKERINLASLIGLLHDIGRFKQIEIFKNCNDLLDFDHGDFGAEFLSKNLRDFIEDDQYDKIIVKAVKNHNKYKIEDGLNDEELLFSKLIRDADKLDILYEATVIFWNGVEDIVNNTVISDYVYNCIKKYEIVNSKKILDNNHVDNVIKCLAFTFDFNFSESLEMLKSKNYINDIIDRFSYKDFETNKKMEEIRLIVNNYIDSRI